MGHLSFFHLYYIYDETGAPIGMLYHKASYADGVFNRYLFERDVFGNVISVYNIETGAKVGSYCYDAWGNCTVLTNTDDIGALNPFRYRGYYLDTETNLYYLQTRYYDSYVGRFINADGNITTGQGLTGNNMFAYCGNNPVNRIDPTGEFWITVLIAAVVLACTATLTSCSAQSSSEYGCATPYTSSTSTKFNCYAYALGETEWKYVGGNPDAVTNYDVDIVAQMVLEDAKKDGRSIRIIDSYDSPINSNEYRIALRTGVDDYHFMVQHSDGTWSHKPGICPTRLIDGNNPSVVTWDMPIIDSYQWYRYRIVREIGSVDNYYNSKTVYFAVSK